jgi:putative ABC transport system permease protein
MWNNFFKTAIRNSLKYRSYTLANIIGLSVGLSIFISLCLFIQYEFSFDKFHKNREYLYRVEQEMNEGGRKEKMTGTPEPLWQALERDFPEVEKAIRIVPSPFPDSFVDKEGNTIRVKTMFAGSDFLQVFTYPLTKGDVPTCLSSPLSIVITEELAGKLFHDDEALGKNYDFNGTLLTVTGVLKDLPGNTHLDFDAIISIDILKYLFGEDTFSHWGNNWVNLYVLMKPGSDITRFNEKIKNILKKYFYEGTLNELYARPLNEIHLYADITDDYAVRGSIKNVYIMIAIAIFILIMGGINFTNLTVAYSSLRVKEVAIRKIQGGSPSLLLIQFMGESLIMSLVSLLLAFVLFETFLPFFNQLVNRELSFNYLENYKLFLLILSVGTVLGSSAGLYPAILISGYHPLSIFKKYEFKTRRDPLLRKILIGFQFLISSALITGTIGISRQANYMKNTDLGYNPRLVMRIPFRDSTMVRIRTMREELLKNPGILAATVHDYPVFQSDNWTRVSWEGAQDGEWIRMNINYVDEHFIDTYEMRLKEGEGFTGGLQRTSGGEKQVILNEAAVKRVGFDNPIGKKISYWGDYRLNNIGSVTVVGVVENFHFLSLHNLITPFMFRLYDTSLTGQSISFRLEGHNISKNIDLICNQFQNFFPEQAFVYDFVYESQAQMYAEEDRLSRVVMALSILAIIIACMGVYGLIAFITVRRIKEIGIRKAMGAGSSNIIRLFLSEFSFLIIIGNILAWPAVYFIVRSWLQSFPYKVDFSLLPYLLALILTVITAGISMLFHTYSASQINPANCLRHE